MENAHSNIDNIINSYNFENYLKHINFKSQLFPYLDVDATGTILSKKPSLRFGVPLKDNIMLEGLMNQSDAGDIFKNLNLKISKEF